MPELLPIVAQRCMDLYYQSYKSSSQFFDLDDFVFYTGTTIAAIYQEEAKLRYAELRALKQEEVVSFPADWLLEQPLKVERKNNETYVILTQPVMGFSFDNQVLGVQDVLPIKPVNTIFERTSQAAVWQSRHIPYTQRTFWYVVTNKILFFNKGGCNVSEVKVLYVPAISNEMLVADGIIKMAMDQTVATMKQLAQGTVVKKSIDENQNMVLESEINKQSLK